MVKLLVIADDFTGALDTAVQFKAKSSLVLLCDQGSRRLEENLQKDIQVLIVDTETRHLLPEEAYRVVYDVVSVAEKLGVPCIYKKTDSGMRGNIGSELTACLRASASTNIHYIPAFPQMGRITKNGVHYIDGIPVSDSVFGKDPFEPVKKSSVREILSEQSDAPIFEMGKSTEGCTRDGILVYDSATGEDIFRIASGLKEKKQTHLLSGCAGFAAALFKLASFEPREEKLPVFDRKLLTVCGSINSVTVSQLDYASARGMHRICLTPQQKLTVDWARSDAGAACLRNWRNGIRQHEDAIIECGVHDIENTAAYMKEKGIPLVEARRRISNTMGSVLERLLDGGVKSTLLVTGGDTLLAFMKQVKKTTLVPVCEIVPGVVVSQLEYRNEKYNLISKSGGFGKKDLLLQLSKTIKNQKICEK